MRIRKNSFMILAAICFSVTVCACGSSSDSGIVTRRRGTGADTQAVLETETADSNAEETAELYILTGVDAAQKTVDVKKASNGRAAQYAYDTGTQFLDKYGNTKSAESFLSGDAVELQIEERDQRLTAVQLSDQVWVQENIVNYSVDEEIHAVTIGQKIFSYEPDMKIFSGDSSVEFRSLGAEDVLRAVGQDKKILSLAVTKGHGYLALSNTKLFEGSFICIGEKIFQEVEKNMKIEVPEGAHLVTVANNGYGGSKEVVIERNQTLSLNLDEL